MNAGSAQSPDSWSHLSSEEGRSCERKKNFKKYTWHAQEMQLTSTNEEICGLGRNDKLVMAFPLSF